MKENTKGIFRRLDYVLLILVTVCAATGVVMLYHISAKGISEQVAANDWLVQLIAMGAGLIGCIIVSLMDYRKIAKFWFLYAPVALGLVALTFTSLGYGREGADDTAWVDLGFIQIQPSEILKIAFLLTFSLHLSKVGEKLNHPLHLLLLLLHAAVPAGLVALQGDYGTAIVFAMMIVCMLFAAGLSFWYLLAGLAALPIACWILWECVFSNVHRERILVLFHPGSDPLGLEYQQDLGLKAMRAGGLFGLGFDSDAYVTVPEMHNDFIFSYMVQVMGFLGALVMILVMAVICLRLFYDSRAAKDTMGKSICIGVLAMLFTHYVLNLGMVLKVLPVIGIPLPFFSAGGTAMLSMYLCVGLANSAYTHNIKKYRMFYDAE